MTQPVHTPGPIQASNPAAGCKNDGLHWQLLEVRKDEIGARRIIASNISADYARLLAAAYNAFDSAAKKLNCNAVELAERMQDGGIAELSKCLAGLILAVECNTGDSVAGLNEEIVAAASHGRTILSKVKGAAA